MKKNEKEYLCAMIIKFKPFRNYKARIWMHRNTEQTYHSCLSNIMFKILRDYNEKRKNMRFFEKLIKRKKLVYIHDLKIKKYSIVFDVSHKG